MLYRQKQRGSCGSWDEPPYGNSSSYNYAKKLETIVSIMDRVEVKFALSGYGIKWDKGMTTQQLKRRLIDELFILIGTSSGNSSVDSISQVADGVRSAILPAKTLTMTIMLVMYMNFSYIFSNNDFFSKINFRFWSTQTKAQFGFATIVQGLSLALGNTAGAIIGIPIQLFSMFMDKGTAEEIVTGGNNFKKIFGLQGQSNITLKWQFLPAAKQALIVAVGIYGLTYIVEAISKAVNVKKSYVERVVDTLMQTDLRHPNAKIYQEIKEKCNKKGQFECKMSNDCEWKKCHPTEDCEMKCSVSMLNKLKYKTSKDDKKKPKTNSHAKLKATKKVGP